MSSSVRVLIVDSSAESRDVLRILLERQGTETLEATGAASAKALLRREKPDLIVLDAECDNSPSQQETLDLGRCATLSAIPIVVLGTAKRHLSPLTAGQFVTKPYHYGPLIRRIERLLESRK